MHAGARPALQGSPLAGSAGSSPLLAAGARCPPQCLAPAQGTTEGQGGGASKQRPGRPHPTAALCWMLDGFYVQGSTAQHGVLQARASRRQSTKAWHPGPAAHVAEVHAADAAQGLHGRQGQAPGTGHGRGRLHAGQAGLPCPKACAVPLQEQSYMCGGSVRSGMLGLACVTMTSGASCCSRSRSTLYSPLPEESASRTCGSPSKPDGRARMLLLNTAGKRAGKAAKAAGLWLPVAY